MVAIHRDIGCLEWLFASCAYKVCVRRGLCPPVHAARSPCNFRKGACMLRVWAFFFIKSRIADALLKRTSTPTPILERAMGDQLPAMLVRVPRALSHPSTLHGRILWGCCHAQFATCAARCRYRSSRRGARHPWHRGAACAAARRSAASLGVLGSSPGRVCM